MPQDKKQNPFSTTPPKVQPTPIGTQRETPANPFSQPFTGQRTNPFSTEVQTQEKPGTLGKILTTISPVVEFLSRGQYASAKFFDGVSDSSKGFFEIISEAAQEAYDPKQKLSFRNLLEKNAPEWTAEHSTAASVIGFIGDVALDPTTYLGVGLGKTGLKIGGKALTKFGEKELVEGIQQFSKIGTQVEVRHTVEKLIELSTTVDQKLAEKVFKKEGIRLTAGLPFGKSYDIPGTRELFRALGLEALRSTVGDVSDNLIIAAAKESKLAVSARTIAATFQRYPKEFSDEYKIAAKQLENSFDYISSDVIRTSRKLFENVSPQRREEIGSVMSLIDDATRDAENKLNRQLTISEAVQIKRNRLSKANLSEREFSIISVLYQDYKSAADLEVTAGLLKHTLSNYSPTYYSELADPSVLVAIHKGKFGLSSAAPSFYQRSFPTTRAAIAKGFVPELDAAVLYAHRLVLGRRALAADHFKTVVKDQFGVDSLNKLPVYIKNDLHLMGESIYPKYMNSDVANWLKVITQSTGIWRRLATTAKPGFAPKQGVSNTIQSAMIQGIKAFKAFDPRSAIDAAMLMMDRTIAPNKLPEFFSITINKFFGSNTPDAVLAGRVATGKIGGLHILEDRISEAASKFELTNVLGERYTGQEIVTLARKNNIVRGYDSTGERLEKNLRAAIGFNDRGRSVSIELMKWWNHAAVVEDYGRMLSFINGLRMGHSVEESVNITNKALFDYAHGLSAIEKNVIREIIPFYTFQRFAIPFVLQQLVKKPSAALTVDKTFKLFEKLIVKGESLNESERDIFGSSFLIEQPRLFKGFDKEGKATFNLLSNLSPIEAISLIKYDKNGEVDLQKTSEQTIFAAITPFLKIPVELAVNRNFFSQQVIDKGGSLGNIDPESKLTNILPAFVKDLIGWEARTNKISGETKVYINPYLSHTSMSFFPALKQFIKPFDADRGMLGGVTELLTGITEVKIDLKQQSNIIQTQRQNELRELLGKLRSAQIRGSLSQMEKAQEDLKLLMSTMAKTAKLQREQPIRQTEESLEGTTPVQKEFK